MAWSAAAAVMRANSLRGPAKFAQRSLSKPRGGARAGQFILLYQLIMGWSSGFATIKKRRNSLRTAIFAGFSQPLLRRES
jgi:hypothetical protein